MQESKGVSYHCVRTEYKDGTIEECVTHDEIGEDCNAYNLKDQIVADNKDEIISINVIHLKDVAIA